jgi:predicted RNA methylase
MKKQRWIDLSARGMYLGHIKGADGMERFALLDMNNSADARKLADIGFLPPKGSPRFERGVYLLQSADQAIRPSALASALGMEKVPLIDVLPGEADKVFREKAQEKFEANINAVVLRAPLLGLNANGQRVYDGAAGRFVRTGPSEVALESSEESRRGGAAFLRAVTQTDLLECAQGFVRTIIDGNIRTTWDDMQKFARTVFDRAPSDGDMHRAQEAVEAAAMKAFAMGASGMDGDSFQLATDLYFGVPPARMRTAESVLLQQYSTPLPMAMVAQKLLFGPDSLEGKSILEPTGGYGALVSMVPSGTEVCSVELDKRRFDVLAAKPGLAAHHGDATEVPFKAVFGKPDGFDYVVANPPFGRLGFEGSFDKIKSIRRIDHFIALRSLQARKDEGRSVFVLAVDDRQTDGSIKGEARGVYNYIHDHYDVLGFAELDARLYSRHGAGYNMRMIVVGDRLESPRTADVPEVLRQIRSFDELWSWSEELLATYPVKAADPALSGRPSASVGQRVRYTPHDLEDRFSPGVVEGLVVDVGNTSGGDFRYRVRTDQPAPQGGGNIEVLVYGKNGRIEALTPENTVDESLTAVLDDMGIALTDAMPMEAPDGWVVMNAPRPLLGTKVLEGGDFLSGRFYAAIDPNDSLALEYAKRNDDLAARVVFVASRDEQVAMATATSEYRDRYFSEMDSDERYEAARGLIRRLHDHTFAEARALLEGARAFLAAKLDAGAAADEPQSGADEVGTGEAVETGEAEAPAGQVRSGSGSGAQRSGGGTKPPRSAESTAEVSVDVDALGLEDAAVLGGPTEVAEVSGKETTEPWQMTSAEWQAAHAAIKVPDDPRVRHSADSMAARLGEKGRLAYGVTAWWHQRAVAGDLEAREWILEQRLVEHKDVVLKALAEKKPVPLRVLEEYPDMKAAQPKRAINEFQTPYQPASKVSAPSAMVPINMAAATYAALADLEMKFGPIDRYVADKLKIKPEALGDYFDAEQVDALGLAIRSVDEGRGFINADMTGRGKGRFVAAMMRYAKVQGKTPVFLTIKPELFTDIFRDIGDIGSGDLFKKLFIFNDGVNVMKFGTEDKVAYKATSVQERRKAIDAMAVDADVDMVLATYSQFQRAGTQNLKAQLLTAACKNNGMLFLDESHVASGASNISMTVGESVANSAGVIYSSATPLKGVTNFAIYNKVFPSSVDLVNLPATLKSGGEALQEAISANMARDGVFIRREHDFSKLTFATRMPSDERKERNVALSNDLAGILSQMSYLSGDVKKVIDQMNSKFTKEWEEIPPEEREGSRMKASSMNFGSRLYAINRQFLLGIKIEEAIEASLQALQEGRKPVIAVENTGESLLRQVLSRRAGVESLEATLADLEERDGKLTEQEQQHKERIREQIANSIKETRLETPPQFRELLEIMLDRIGEIKVQTRYGEYETKRPSSKEYKESEDALRERIRAFGELPLTPIDLIKHELGSRGFPVAEVSGRGSSLKVVEDLWAPSFHPKSDAVANVAGFQSGKFDAIVITRSGSTGISLHATDRFADSDIRQRDFIVLQKAANIAEFLQWLGRVNRKDQVIEPIITGIESSLPAEWRLTMMHNAKLRKLSANTTSNRDNENVVGEDLDLLNEVGDEVALQWLYQNPHIADYLDIDLPKDDDGASHRAHDFPYINKLLGRLMMVDVPTQQSILDSLSKRFAERVEELEQKGENPFKVHVFEWQAKTIKSEELQSGSLRTTGSTFDSAVNLVTVEYEQDVYPIRSDKLKSMVRNGQIEYKSLGVLDEGKGLGKFIGILQAGATKELRKRLPPKLQESERQLHEILADKDAPASVVRARDQIDFLIRNLPSMKPGAAAVTSDLFRGEQRGIVTRVSFPDRPDDIYLLSQYRMSVAVPGEERTSEITMATLFNQDSPLASLAHRALDLDRLDKGGYGVEAMKATLREFDAAPDGKVRRAANLLQGNLFRACEMAAKERLGAPVLYTDETGNRQRGVLLRGHVTPEAIKALPVALSPREVGDYLDVFLAPDHKDHRSRTMFGSLHVYAQSFREVKKGEALMFEILQGGDRFRLSLPGTKTKGGGLITEGSIFDIGAKTPPGSLRLKLAGTRGVMQVDMTRDVMIQVMERMVRGNYASQFYVPKPDQDTLKALKIRYQHDRDFAQTSANASSVPTL